MDKKLLSICIPTYNRALELELNLEAILKGSDYYQDKVEVIVSDNASTDSTQKVLKEMKIKYPHLKAYRNETNLGFNLNFFKLSDEYASGKYFWLIGDDDILYPNAINIVIKALARSNDIPFLGLNFNVLSIKDIEGYNYENNDQTPSVLTMEQLINLQCRPENVLTTFISCNIILLEKFKAFKKSAFSNKSWDNTKSLFPHAYMIANTIKPNENVLFLKEPILSVISHEKEWDDKLPTIALYHLVNLYRIFLSFGYTDIINVKRVVIKQGASNLNVKNKLPNKIYFLKFAILQLSLYKLIIEKLIKTLKSLKS